YKAYDWHKFPAGTAATNVEYQRQFGAMFTPNPVPGLLNLALSPSAGVLWYAPTLLLCVGGWLAWRRQQPRLCAAVLAASLLYAFFLCFLTFFKGEPCWGPRYLTPVLALWWLFVPADLARLRRPSVRWLLGLGLLVQLLALSVDPQRLLLRLPLPFTY